MGLAKKLIKCTINFNLKPSFACDLWMWQNIPNDLGFNFGYFSRIVNEKNLQIEANEGTWAFGWEPTGGWWDTIAFYENPPPKKPFDKQHIFFLTTVPFDFIEQVIAGKILSEKDRGMINKPVAQLDWKMWS